MDIDIEKILDRAEKMGPGYAKNIIKAFSEIANREPLTEDNCDVIDIPWEDDDFSRRIFTHATRTPDETKLETDFLIEKCNLKQGMRVLDIASGDGRLSIEFGRRGYPVVGIDKGIGGIEYARNIVQSLNLNEVQFIHGNAVDVDFSGEFDFAMIIFGAIANFTRDEASKLLQKLSGVMKNSSRFVIEVCLLLQNVIGDFHEWYFSGTGLWGDSVYLVMSENFFNAQDQYMAIRHWIIDTAIGDYRMVTGREQYYDEDSIAELLQEGGFNIEHLYGDWNGSEYTTEGDCLIVQAIKTFENYY